MLPFSTRTTRWPNGSGYCPQCGILCHVDRDHPRVTGTAQARMSRVCHGCQYANATRAQWQTWIGSPWRTNPDTLSIFGVRIGRTYAYYGPRMTFAIWKDLWRGYGDGRNDPD